MALLQSALLAAGSFLAILWFFAQIPQLIRCWRSKALDGLNTRPLLLLHTAHLIWLLYAARLWDYDWFLPNVMQAVVSFAHWTLFHLLLTDHVTFLSRYAISVPLVLLTLWRVLPASLLALLAVVVEVLAQGVYVRDLAALRTEGVVDLQSLRLKTSQSLLWAAFGYFRRDWAIMGAFGLGAVMTAGEFIAQKMVGPSRKQR